MTIEYHPVGIGYTKKDGAQRHMFVPTPHKVEAENVLKRFMNKSDPLFYTHTDGYVKEVRK